MLSERQPGRSSHVRVGDWEWWRRVRLAGRPPRLRVRHVDERFIGHGERRNGERRSMKWNGACVAIPLLFNGGQRYKGVESAVVGRCGLDTPDEDG